LFRRVRAIVVTGAFPLLEQEIVDAMRMAAGDPFRPERLPAMASAVAELFESAAFIDPDVRIVASETDAGRGVVLHVRIQKGPYLKVAGVDLAGNVSVPDRRLIWRLKTWQASRFFGLAARFRSDDLSSDIDRLLRFYRKTGYADVAVTASAVRQTETRSVHITFTIDEGAFYRVSFIGNRRFRPFVLRRDLAPLKSGNPADLGVRKSVRNILRRYRRSGYADCRIETTSETITEAQRSVRELTFVIAEGKRHVVDAIQISGNDAIGAETIRKQMLTVTPGWFDSGAYDLSELDADVDALRLLYHRNGYLSHRVAPRITTAPSGEKSDQPVVVEIQIDEGIQTRVAQIDFDGLHALSSAAAAGVIRLKPGAPFDTYQLKSDENALAAAIAERGYPHVSVAARWRLHSDRHWADVSFHIAEGNFVTMGRVIAVGHFRTRRKVIEEEVVQGPEEPFSLRKLLTTQRRLRDIDAFQRVDFTTVGLADNADRVHMVVGIQERKPYFLELAFGYDTERHMYAAIQGGDLNVFGLNKDLRTALEVSEIGYRAEVNLTEPRFMGTRIRSVFNVHREEKEEFNKDFGIRTLGGSVTFERAFGERVLGALALSGNRREQYLLVPRPVPGPETGDFEPRTVFTASPSVIYNATDSFIRPRAGMHAATTIDVSKGIENTLDDFVRYQLALRYYLHPLPQLTLAARARGGIISPYNTQRSVPSDQLFFLGGTGSVRGFNENSLRIDADGFAVGGLSHVFGSLEARWDIGMNLELAGFVDVGQIGNALVAAGTDGVRASIGTGVRYLSTIGAVSLYYGHNLDRQAGEPAGRLHFSLGFTF
jgi:outer membrane protein insertion porin family